MTLVDHRGKKLGKKAARYDHRTLLLSSYLKPHLPAAPPVIDWTGKVADWPMYLNDSLGDCTCADAAHMIQAWTANVGAEVIVTDNDVLAMYAGACGYVQGDPSTDQGGVELDVLNYWRETGLAGHKIGAYVSVPISSQTLTMDALWLFGGLYAGVALPVSAQTQRVWDVPHGGTFGQGSSGSWGGHAVPIVGADARGLTVVTWGSLKRMTWEFYESYFDECYAILSPDFVSGTVSAPNGFDLAALQEDLAAL